MNSQDAKTIKELQDRIDELEAENASLKARLRCGTDAYRNNKPSVFPRFPEKPTVFPRQPESPNPFPKCI